MADGESFVLYFTNYINDSSNTEQDALWNSTEFEVGNGINDVIPFEQILPTFLSTKILVPTALNINTNEIEIKLYKTSMGKWKPIEEIAMEPIANFNTIVSSQLGTTQILVPVVWINASAATDEFEPLSAKLFIDTLIMLRNNWKKQLNNLSTRITQYITTKLNQHITVFKIWDYTTNYLGKKAHLTVLGYGDNKSTTVSQRALYPALTMYRFGIVLNNDFYKDSSHVSPNNNSYINFTPAYKNYYIIKGIVLPAYNQGVNLDYIIDIQAATHTESEKLSKNVIATDIIQYATDTVSKKPLFFPIIYVNEPFESNMNVYILYQPIIDKTSVGLQM